MGTLKKNKESLKNITKANLIWGLCFVLIAGVSFGYYFKSYTKVEGHVSSIEETSIEEQREAWIDIGDNIRTKLVLTGKYNCCLENPCWYCIQKTPGHGEGAECTCRQDILAGEHPCGECIGEILEGHGLSELVPYYAKAISHKVGDEHLGHLKEIIDAMY